jgi:hypothetical protein
MMKHIVVKTIATSVFDICGQVQPDLRFGDDVCVDLPPSGAILDIRGLAAVGIGCRPYATKAARFECGIDIVDVVVATNDSGYAILDANRGRPGMSQIALYSTVFGAPGVVVMKVMPLLLETPPQYLESNTLLLRTMLPCDSHIRTP